jgi:ubiquitin-activating enzyme E1
LIADNIGIPKSHDLHHIKEIVNKVHVPVFVPNSNAKIDLGEKKPGEEEKKQEMASEDDFTILDELKKQIDHTHIGVSSKDFHPVDFEKDDDSNFHIDFIHAAAQLRAENYDIKPCER